MLPPRMWFSFQRASFFIGDLSLVTAGVFAGGVFCFLVFLLEVPALSESNPDEEEESLTFLFILISHSIFSSFWTLASEF